MSSAPPAAPPRWHRFLEHTGEMRLEVRGESLGGLLAEAGRALGLLLCPTPGRSATAPESRIVEVRAHDREALLIDWLNEIVFLAETELLAPVEIEVLDASERGLRASVRGVSIAAAPSLIKAATLHDLRIEPDGDGLRAEVVLDV